MTTKLTDDLAAARTFGYEHAHAAGRELHAETGVKFTMVPGPESGTYIVGIERDGVLLWIATEPTDRTPESYTVYETGESLKADPAPMTRAEAEAVAELVRRDRRPRMGMGRLAGVTVYQQRTPGAPWSVQLSFKGELYECGRTRRRLHRHCYVHRVRFTDGTDAKGKLTVIC